MFKIIKARKIHCDDVYNLIKECSIWMSKQKMNHWINAYPKNIIQKMISYKDVYLILLNDTPVGTITTSDIPHSYYIEEDKKYWEESNSKKVIYLSGLAVLPEYHNKGIASRLIEYIEKIAKSKGIKYIRFDAVGYYKKLIKFYTNRGYKIVGNRIVNNLSTYFFEKCL